MKNNRENEGTGSCKTADWQVLVSRDMQIIINVKQMSIEMSRTRLKPVFSSVGHLIIVVSGISGKDVIQ